MKPRTRTIILVVLALVCALGAGRAAAAARKYADLAAKRIIAAPQSLVAGTSTSKWRFRIANVSAVKSMPLAGAVYLSRDKVRGRGDVRLGRVSVRAISAHGRRTVVIHLAVPISVAPGTYRLIGCALPAAHQVQVTKRNDCVAAANSTAVVPPAPVLTSISEGGRGATLHPAAHGSHAPVGATVSAYDSISCGGAVLGTATVGEGGTFDIAYDADLDWGASITMSVRITSAHGNSGCSNALGYTHRGATYTWTADGYTGPATIPVDSLVRIVNAAGRRGALRELASRHVDSAARKHRHARRCLRHGAAVGWHLRVV